MMKCKYIYLTFTFFGVLGLLTFIYFFIPYNKKDCKNDLLCIAEKHHKMASLLCINRITSYYTPDSKWTNNWFQRKFTHVAWGHEKNEVVSYYGDSIKFKNSYGNWKNFYYKCDYSISSGNINIDLYKGRLIRNDHYIYLFWNRWVTLPLDIIEMKYKILILNRRSFKDFN